MDTSEPYSSTAPRPAGSTITMKVLTSLIAVFVIAQPIVAVLFGLYLHKKVDKHQAVVEYNQTSGYGRDAFPDRVDNLRELHRSVASGLGLVRKTKSTQHEIGDEINLREDFLFLRRLQRCRKPQDSDETFLDCTKILSNLQDLLQDQKSEIPPESLLDKRTGDKRQAVSIHLAGLQSSKIVLQWKRPPYAPMDSDTFSYRDGKIKVGKRGQYYIYSQVAFCPNQAPFSLYVYLNLPTEADQLLLHGVGTFGKSDHECALQSIHVGRAVELQEGHVIFVKVTNSSSVNYNHANTYFGMFELS